MNQNIRYALLAGTMLLPAIAVPQAGMAAAGLAAAGLAADSVSARSSEGAIILAQAIDPATGKVRGALDIISFGMAPATAGLSGWVTTATT